MGQYEAMRHGELNWRRALAVACVAGSAALLSGCGSTSGWLGDAVGDAGAVGNRFSQLFGSSSQPAGTPVQEQRKASEPTCPGVDIRSGASTLAVGLPGKPASGTDLRYQGTITDTARECTLSGGTVAAKIGVQGRIIVGPAGAPASVTVPIRIAVVQEGPQPKTIFSKVYQTTVAVPSDQPSAVYSLVAEDISYPVPGAEAAESYIFYVGFDPDGSRPARAKPPKRSRN